MSTDSVFCGKFDYYNFFFNKSGHAEEDLKVKTTDFCYAKKMRFFFSSSLLDAKQIEMNKTKKERNLEKT